MANSDKNILITPSKDTSNFPTISFVGQNNSPITLNVLDDNSISFRSSLGDELYTLTSNLTSGNIFSISDISGVPSFFANANGTIGIAPYYGQVAVGQATAATYLDVYGPSGITSFTGSNRLGIATRGSRSSTDYSGIDFYGYYGNQQDSSFSGYDRPFGRIGLRSQNDGSYLCFGTSNSYATGITNYALSINPSGWVGVGGDAISVMSIASNGGGPGNNRQLTLHQVGQPVINFGSYPANWNPALMIQNIGNTDFIWLSPIDDGYNARFRTGGCGLDFYIGGGNDTGSLLAALNTGANGQSGGNGHLHLYGPVRQRAYFDNGRHYSFYTYLSTAGGTYYVHMKTNIPYYNSYCMTMIQAWGYAYGNGGRIDCSWNFYTYATGQGPYSVQYWTDSTQSSATGMEASTMYQSSDGYCVIVGYTTGHYYIGFTLDAVFVNPTPGGFAVQIDAATYSASQTGVY